MDSARQQDAPDPRVNAAIQDYLERIDRGEAVDAEQFLAQHGEIAVELRSFIDGSEELARRAAEASPPEAAEVSTNRTVQATNPTASPGGGASAKSLPEQFGRYRVQRLLGRGAMGEVYLAQDTQLHRQVALKVPSFDDDESDQLLQRFYREARTAATLRSPHICPVYDVGEIDGRHYISMAYIDGRTLSQVIKTSGPQPERQVLLLVRKLALALQEAHEQGIIHRDLKPGNVMIDAKSEPIVMDFGLAFQIRDDAARLTHSGVLIGSPAYMSPEQVEGDPTKITAASDQCSLGIMLYELLTGELPFRGSVTAVIGQIVAKPVPSPRQLRPDLDPRIEALCLKMVAKSPQDRFPSMKAVADEIAAILKTAPKAEKPAAAPTTKTVKAAETTTTERDRWKDEIPALFGLAQNLVRKHDYAEARQVLAKIPPGVRTPEIEQMLADAADKDDECGLLLTDIEQALQQQMPSGLQPLVKRFLQLKPGHREMQQLAADLKQHGPERAVQLHRGQRKQFDAAGRTIEPKHVALLVCGLVALCALAYGSVIAFQTPHGTVIVEVHSPGVTVNFANDEITAQASGKSYKVKPTEKKTLQVEVDGVTIDSATQEITVAKNETKYITARLLPDKTLELTVAAMTKTFAAQDAVTNSSKTDRSGATAATEEWISLFNGTDLTGWMPFDDAWRVRNGVIEIQPNDIKGHTSLLTKESYGDFELRLQCRVLNNAGIAVAVRSVNDHERKVLGPGLLLGSFTNGRQKQSMTGNLVFVSDLKSPDLAVASESQRRKIEPALIRGEWLDVYLRCEGPRIVTEINGERTADYTNTSGRVPRSGPLGIGVSVVDKVAAEVRNIRVRKLPAGSLAPAGITTGEVAIRDPSQNRDSKPAVVPTASKAPKVLFVDDYDKPQGYWSNTTAEQLKDNPNHSWGFRDGIYFDEVRAPSWYFGSLPGGPYPDCSWETLSRITGSNASSRGAFVLHLFQEKRGIQVRIDGTGVMWIAPSSATFEDYKAGPWAGPITHRAIKPGGSAYNKVRLDIRKRRLDVFVNDTAVVGPLEFDWDLTPARFSTGVDCQSPNVRAEHDRMEIRELLEPAKVIDPAAELKPIRYFKSGTLRFADGTFAYEGAAFKIAEVTGGSANPQWDLQAFNGVWTNDCQLLWSGAKANNSLSLDLPIETDGLYQLVGGFTLGPDFGRAKFALDGQPLNGDKFIELYDPTVQPAKPVSLGTIPLTKGKKRLTVTMTGKHRSSTGFVFGLDELRLVPAK